MLGGRGRRRARRTGPPCGIRLACTIRTRRGRVARGNPWCRGLGGVLLRTVRLLDSNQALSAIALWCIRNAPRQLMIYHTFSKQSPSHMMQLRITIRKFPRPRTPRDHLAHIPLLRRLIRRKRPQQRQQLPLHTPIPAFLPTLPQHLHEQAGQVPAGAALSGLQQGERAAVDYVGCGVPVFGFYVARGDGAELLVGFVVVA